MSMLAEPRRKTQQCFINPRGDAWSKDENKFGQKLMEKFGWSKGKGLGREEQGMTDCIKVLTKDNKKGIGFKGSDDEWIKHYEGFESVLANLNSDNSKENSASNSAANSDDESKNTSSLERRSKGSRARVHYHKFTRGKDVSRYNSDDIACIIGSKRSKQLADIEATQIKEEDEVGQQVKLNGVTTVKGGTVQEYFAEKMAKLKMAQALQQKREDEDNSEERSECEIGAQNGRQGFGYCYEEQTPVNGKVSESEREERVGFAFEYPENGDDCTGNQAEKKKKKKKKKDKSKEKEVEGEEESVSDTENSKAKKRMREVDEDLEAETQGEVDMIVKKKKKKKKKSNQEKEEEDEDDAVAENLTIENCHEEEAEKLHIDDNEKEKKTKHKKKKANLDVMKAEELPTENNCKTEPDNMQSENGVNSEKKKKNKKKKSKDKSTEELPTENGCERESASVDGQKTDEERGNEEEINGVEDAGNEIQKSKKKKKRKIEEIDGDNEESSVTEPQSSEKKKKKKKKSLCQEEIQEENCSEPSVELPEVVPQDCSDVGEAKIGEETVQEEESVPKRKKGKKKKQKRNADKDENSPSEKGEALSVEEKGHSSTAEGKKEGAESEKTNNSEDKSDGKKR